VFGERGGSAAGSEVARFEVDRDRARKERGVAVLEASGGGGERRAKEASSA
jgi:hypothetical protein